MFYLVDCCSGDVTVIVIMSGLYIVHICVCMQNSSDNVSFYNDCLLSLILFCMIMAKF